MDGEWWIYSEKWFSAGKNVVVLRIVYIQRSYFRKSLEIILRGDTKKTDTFEKTQQKLKKSKKKNLLTEIEPLQLTF